MTDWAGNVQQCVLSAHTVGGPVLTPASASSHTAAPRHCHSLHTTSQQRFCITGIRPPPALTWCGTCGAPLSDHWSKHALADKGAGSPTMTPSAWAAFDARPLGEPMQLMSSLPSSPARLAWLFLLFSRPLSPRIQLHYQTSVCHSLRFNRRTGKYHQQEDFSQTDVLRKPLQSPYNHLRLSKLPLMA